MRGYEAFSCNEFEAAEIRYESPCGVMSRNAAFHRKIFSLLRIPMRGYEKYRLASHLR